MAWIVEHQPRHRQGRRFAWSMTAGIRRRHDPMHQQLSQIRHELGRKSVLFGNSCQSLHWLAGLAGLDGANPSIANTNSLKASGRRNSAGRLTSYSIDGQDV